MSAAALLDVEGLSVRGQAHQLLLDNVSFQLEPGEVVGVLGPNGAGKTTLLRCLFGAQSPHLGTVRFSGCDIKAMSARQRAKRIAAVTQETPGDFQLSVRSVIATGRTPHQHWLSGRDLEGAEVIAQTVERFKLAHLLDKDIDQLSGGERKRVMIARALVQQPQLLVLDEPCNHLDIEHQLSLMRQLRELPVSCLVSLHDFHLAARYCDRLIVLNRGRVVGAGSPEQVLTSDLFASIFGVCATPYQNPWSEWSFYPREALGRAHTL
ncbi:MAG: ABC transporter ATP-binding protein [Pseudomonadales bacterium]